MNYNLKNDSTKQLVLEMSRSGKSGRQIGLELGISPRAVQEFLAKDTWVSWWNSAETMQLQYDPDDVKFRDFNVDSCGYFKFNDSKSSGKKILVIADTQCKPTEDLSYMTWIGKYIYEKQPDVIVHIGDHYDCPSLSSYDKGKKSFEGRRLKQDIEAGNNGMRLLVNEFLKNDYSPRMVFCMGNHEERIDRLANDMPELDGFVGTELLPLEDLGWDVYPFLKPVEIEGIFFVHYLANPFSGKPYGGSALNQLKHVGRSFVVGHKQCLDIAIRPTLDGKHQLGIINGAAYPFDESYKGYQGNNHFRGITMLHEVKDGFGLPMFVSLDYLKEKYAKI